MDAVIEIRRNGKMVNHCSAPMDSLAVCAHCGDDLAVHEWIDLGSTGYEEVACDRVGARS